MVRAYGDVHPVQIVVGRFVVPRRVLEDRMQDPE